MRGDDFPEVDPALLTPEDPFGYDATPSGTFNDPRAPVVLSKAELDFRDMMTNRRRGAERARWTRECLARWEACHPPKPRPPKVKRPSKPAAPPKYTKRWTGIIDEQG
jgi:hypothetical protein